MAPLRREGGQVLADGYQLQFAVGGSASSY